MKSSHTLRFRIPPPFFCISPSFVLGFHYSQIDITRFYMQHFNFWSMTDDTPDELSYVAKLISEVKAVLKHAAHMKVGVDSLTRLLAECERIYELAMKSPSGTYSVVPNNSEQNQT